MDLVLIDKDHKGELHQKVEEVKKGNVKEVEAEEENKEVEVEVEDKGEDVVDDKALKKDKKLELEEILKIDQKIVGEIQILLDKHRKAKLTEKPKIVSDLVTAVLKKFEEFIIDEDEISQLKEASYLILTNHDTVVNDKVDIIYKYAKNYFKESNKQEDVLSVEGKTAHEKNKQNQEEHLAVVGLLIAGINMLLKE